LRIPERTEHETGADGTIPNPMQTHAFDGGD